MTEIRRTFDCLTFLEENHPSDVALSVKKTLTISVWV